MSGREVKPLPLIVGLIVTVINVATFGDDIWRVILSVCGIAVGLVLISMAFPRSTQSRADTAK